LKYTAVILTKKKVSKHFHPWAGVRCLRITPRTDNVGKRQKNAKEENGGH
jgi:hypothetical protein